MQWFSSSQGAILVPVSVDAEWLCESKILLSLGSALVFEVAVRALLETKSQDVEESVLRKDLS